MDGQGAMLNACNNVYHRSNGTALLIASDGFVRSTERCHIIYHTSVEQDKQLSKCLNFCTPPSVQGSC